MCMLTTRPQVARDCAVLSVCFVCACIHIHMCILQRSSVHALALRSYQVLYSSFFTQSLPIGEVQRSKLRSCTHVRACPTCTSMDTVSVFVGGGRRVLRKGKAAYALARTCMYIRFVRKHVTPCAYRSFGYHEACRLQIVKRWQWCGLPPEKSWRVKFMACEGYGVRKVV